MRLKSDHARFYLGVGVACDPRIHDPGAIIEPAEWAALHDEARRIADEEFNREHPGAVIDPGDQA
jgi:hypothetical protein